MLGLVISLITSAMPAVPLAALTCTDGATSCDASVAAVSSAPAPADVPEAPRVYATPAVIDCRAPVVPTVLQTLVGECDGMPRDASYRVSRYPESEIDRGSMTPARPGRDATQLTSCNGLPPAGGDLTISTLQPIALYAAPALVDEGRDAAEPGDDLHLPHRAPDRLDRPPRA